MQTEENLSVDDVKSILHYNKNGSIEQTSDNYVKVLFADPDLVDSIKINELTGQKDVVKDLGWKRTTKAMTDVDADFIYHLIEKRYGLRNDKLLKKAINIVSNSKSYHPIKDILESLEWDGRERIKELLPRYLGAERSELTAWAMKTMMMGLLSRIYNPGCKFELMLCLVGGQGAGKSSFFRLLAIKDEWFTDDLRRIDDDNVYRKMKGHWVIELSEMTATLRSKYIEDIKSFISRQVDVYKVPYEVHPKDIPRQCAFAGSSNNMEFLPFDRTGNRRFIPIPIDATKAEHHPLEDEKETRDFIEQCWAEALTIFKSGKYSFVIPKEIEEQLTKMQKDFMPEDNLSGLIEAWLEECNEEYVCTTMIYQRAVSPYSQERPNHFEARDISEIMNGMEGWERVSTHRFAEYGTQKAWKRTSEFVTLNGDAKAPWD